MATQEKIKLIMEMSPQLYATLDSLAQKIDSDKADVLQKAISLFEVAVKALEEGKEIKFIEPEQVEQTHSLVS
ncbi:MAG: DNA-binding protein [Hormoscilla sp. SP5CHS1]|nr:DNA-binding protein [Hormoscilla sp. SP12CHS1]MBC6451910.1 DNA-binding protein [Hormoscilla sp. SP5CHS1]